jgi:hypothetical protein
MTKARSCWIPALPPGTFGFLRTPQGTLVPVADPADASTPPITEPVGINQEGIITGVFFDTQANEYDSFFLFPNGTYKTYVFPGLPTGSETALARANDVGGLCGWVFPNTAGSQFQAFVSLPFYEGAKNIIFSVTNSVSTFCYGINDFNVAAGTYQDSAGVSQGFVRTAEGAITTIDAPGAATTPGSEPCPVQAGGTPIAGTTVEGINNLGDVSGHFFDTSYNEHGFMLSHTGKFTQIDVPGAFQTAGGGVNDLGKIVGHYTDKSCNPFGYTAQIQSHQY